MTTLDRLNRSDAMQVMKMFYELEEQVDVREYNIYIMKENLKNFNPKKTQFGSSFIISSYLRRVFFCLTFFAIFILTMAIYILIPDVNPIFLYVFGGILAIIDIAIYILIKKSSKKKKKKKFIEQNKDEYEHWISQINNDTKELNILKPAITDEYKKYNIAPEYRSKYAMQSLFNILYHNSTLSVLDAMKKFDEDERARRIAEAQREAGARVSNTISEESKKTRETMENIARKDQEINSAILGKLNDFYYYR